MNSDAPDRLTGRLIDGRYRIGDLIARGGMASVHRALDLRLDREVAIKVMHPGLGDDEQFASRFVREARAAAKLSGHPHVVGVLDQGESDGLVFLVMEYVPGRTLRDLISASAPLTPVRAVELLEPIVSALAAAHGAGVMHRDIKPENVLIGADGAVKVADFGLAKAISTDTNHTATGGVLIGTVSYLAPESVVEGTADARSDVYSTGVLLYELLTGRKPHQGESPIQVAYRHVHHDVEPPSALSPDVPPYLDALVARMTARDPSRRSADARVLLHQVHRVSQALADGVVDDPDLVADLAPSAASPVPTVPTDPTDPDEHDALGEPEAIGEAEHTLVTPRPETAPEKTAENAPRPAEETPPTAGSPRRSARGRRPLIWALVLALLIAVAAGTWWFGFARYTQAPSVLGLDQQAATAKLREAGLTARMGEPEYSETVPAQEVVRSDPGPGGRVLEGGTVTVVLSRGPERYDVPTLTDKSTEDAEKELRDLKLEIGPAQERWSESVDEGKVVSTDPEPGTTLKPGSSVSLIVSKGRRPLTVKDFTGSSADDAESYFDKRGVEVERSQEYSDSVDKGEVIDQSPDSGTVYRGDTVKLTVSRGPELVDIPSGLIASGVESARRSLSEAGLKAKVERSSTYVGLGYVVGVSPRQGTSVPKGSTVTLYVV